MLRSLKLFIKATACSADSSWSLAAASSAALATLLKATVPRKYKPLATAPPGINRLNTPNNGPIVSINLTIGVARSVKALAARVAPRSPLSSPVAYVFVAAVAPSSPAENNLNPTCNPLLSPARSKNLFFKTSADPPVCPIDSQSLALLDCANLRFLEAASASSLRLFLSAVFCSLASSSADKPARRIASA